MRVAICDDDKNAITYLENKVRCIKIITVIKLFDSIDTLKKSVQSGHRYDIVFMDIDWGKNETGIDFAAELNAIDSGMQIIYVTGYNDRFSQHIFLKQVNLCGLLIKPVQDELLRNMVDIAVERIRKNDIDKMIIRQNREVRSIPYRDIVRMESSAHHVTVYCINEQITFYGGLEREKMKLPHYFISTHKSYVVNMNYIRKIDKNRIYLINGEVVDISKSRYLDVRQKYFDYIGEEL